MCSFKNSVKAKKVRCDDTHLWLTLNDGRILAVPRKWFSKIMNASIEQLKNYELVGDGIGIYWKDLDEDINVPNLLVNRNCADAQFE